MNNIKSGTRIYLTKKNAFPLYIQPNKTLTNDNLYVAYDVRIDGDIVIPKGTRVIGNWVTESNPDYAAQLQVTTIYLGKTGLPFQADSDVIQDITEYNNNEVGNVGYLYKQNQYRAESNITRRIVDINCRAKTLFDDNCDTVYIEIFTKEIPVTLISDFNGIPNITHIADKYGVTPGYQTPEQNSQDDIGMVRR